MLLLYSLLLSLCYAIEAFRARRDLFSARFLFNAFAWLKNVPYFITYAENLDEFTIRTYFLYKFVSFLFVNLGISFYKVSSHNHVFLYKERKGVSVNTYEKLAVVLLVLGLLIKYYVISSSGGVMYIINHIQSRRTLMAGKHYYQLVSNAFLTSSVLFSEYCFMTTKTRKSKVLFFISLGLTFLSLVLFGARRPGLMLLLQALMYYHYKCKRIRILSFFKPKYLPVLLALFFFIIMMPMLRRDSTNNFAENPGQWIKESIGNTNSIFHEFSYCEGDIFVFDYFSENPKWNGATYINILYQWIPSSLFPTKPPMDDGMYLINMMYGCRVGPHDSTKSLRYQTSIPFTLEGSLYSNFGLIGIVLGCFLVGILYQLTYKMLIDTKCAIISLMIYQEVMFVFVPSVLHTTSTIIVVAVYSILMYVLVGFRIKLKFHA